MSQGFKLKYDELRENDPTRRTSTDMEGHAATDRFYAEDAHIRNISFVWPDGRRVFFAYAYLITTEYMPSNSEINLIFTTHAIKLSGVNLEVLYNELLHHRNKQIVAADARYNVIGENEAPIVNSISLSEIKKWEHFFECWL